MFRFQTPYKFSEKFPIHGRPLNLNQERAEKTYAATSG